MQQRANPRHSRDKRRPPRRPRPEARHERHENLERFGEPSDQAESQQSADETHPAPPAPAQGRLVEESMREIRQIRSKLETVLRDMNYLLELLNQFEKTRGRRDEELRPLREALREINRETN